MTPALLALTVAGIILLVIFVVFINSFQLWLLALLSGAPVGLTQLIAMRLRKVRPQVIVSSRINAVKAGIDIPVCDLEALYLAGGNVQQVVQAVIAANKAGIDLSYREASAQNLAGRDVLEDVKNKWMYVGTVEIDGEHGSVPPDGTLLRVVRCDGLRLILETVPETDVAQPG